MKEVKRLNGLMRCERRWRKYLFLLTLVVHISGFVQAQEKFTLSGYVKDVSNGEELIGATVLVTGTSIGVVTNAYGFYSIALPATKAQLKFSYVGYQSQTIAVELTKNESRNIELAAENQELQEVVVAAERADDNITNVQISKIKLNMDQVRKLPSALGEVDLIKTIQTQPGVVSAGEGTSSFFVRGGSADQNLIQIDEAPIYDPSHLFGLYSVFNADVVKDVELYKGGIPARYGGRLSSILDVRTKDGNNKKFSGAGGIGTLAARAMVEGPIQQDKSSYLISARRSFMDLLVRDTTGNTVYFYDLNAKFNLKGNNKNRYFLSLYSGRDGMNFGEQFSFGWGNSTATFRWNHLFNNKLF